LFYLEIKWRFSLAIKLLWYTFFERPDSSMILDQKCNDLIVSGIYRDEDSDTLWLATDKGLGL